MNWKKFLWNRQQQKKLKFSWLLLWFNSFHLGFFQNEEEESIEKAENEEEENNEKAENEETKPEVKKEEVLVTTALTFAFSYFCFYRTKFSEKTPCFFHWDDIRWWIWRGRGIFWKRVCLLKGDLKFFFSSPGFFEVRHSGGSPDPRVGPLGWKWGSGLSCEWFKPEVPKRRTF